MCINYFDKESLERWFKDKGDENHRVNYDLNENSLVIDLGGYLGEWTETIHNKYSCNVYVFEPVFKFYNNIVEKFKKNSKIKVFNLGLSGLNDEVIIKYDNASSSIFIENGVEEKIKLVKYYDFINDNKIDYIDLIKINIEGSEYELLEHIIENNLHVKIKNLQIQFHKTFNDSEEKREKIRKVLSLTHKLTYDYTFVWENWEKL
jgi:FkbM family methyltransferase